MAARSFQQSMVVMGKLVQIVSDAHYTLDYLKVLTPEDLLITVSATGNFATLMEPMVQKTDILYSYYVNKYRETDLLQGPISELPLSDSQKMRVQRCAE